MTARVGVRIIRGAALILAVLTVAARAPAPANAQTCPGLDVDGNGSTSLATDIVYIARNLLGLSPVPASFRVLDPSIPSDAQVNAHISTACAGSTATCSGELLKTGQRQCDQGAGTLGACPGSPVGQDAWLKKGASPSYTDNFDGTITDDLTGLMWEKLSDDGSIHDWDANYTWYDAFTGKIAALNTAVFAGHNDWRLPNRRELESLVEAGRLNPAIDPVFNTGCAPGCTVLTCSCTQSGYYWSSSTYGGVATAAWSSAFHDGATSFGGKSTTSAVRAVRDGCGKLLRTGQIQCDQGTGTLGACPGHPVGQDGSLQKGAAFSYVDNGDGTVTDNVTGLMWEKLSDDGSIHDWDANYTWYDAFRVKIAALNRAVFAGYHDWRLPNHRELESLVDLNRSRPAINPVFHTDCVPGCTGLKCSCTQSFRYWSSTTYAFGTTGAWGVYFYDGFVNSYVKTGNGYVRAVRGGS